MTDLVLDNVNVTAERPIVTPDELKTLLPLSAQARDLVFASRAIVRKIIDG